MAKMRAAWWGSFNVWLLPALALFAMYAFDFGSSLPLGVRVGARKRTELGAVVALVQLLWKQAEVKLSREAQGCR